MPNNHTSTAEAAGTAEAGSTTDAESTPAAERTPAGRGRRRIGTDAISEGGDARSRIQDVALELFISDGYDKTSLREIAERLGVTKAALYYHFTTKDDIVNSLVEDRVARLQGLITWARQQPQTQQMRQDLIRLYSADLHDRRHHHLMRFFEANQTAIKTMAAGARLRERMTEISDILCDPGDPLARQLKCAMAIFAINASWFLLRDRDMTDEQRRQAALQVALELIDIG